MCVTKIDPFVRLELLREFINYKIDHWPEKGISFNDFLHLKYDHLIPGTIAYAKRHATHCFYCNKDFSKKDKRNPSHSKITVDHFMPVSINETCTKFVICCWLCNVRKSNTPHETFISMLNRAWIRGQEAFGFVPKVVKLVNERVQQVSNDLLLNAGPRVYYIDNKTKHRA